MIGMTRVTMILRRKKRGRRSSSLVTSSGLKRSCGTSSHGDLRKSRSLVGIGEVFVMSSSCEGLPNSATKCAAVAPSAAITTGATGATVHTLLPPTAWRLVKPQVSTWSIIMRIVPLLAHRGASPPKSYRPSSSPEADVAEAIVITITHPTIHPIFMFQCLHRVPLPRLWMRIGGIASMLVLLPIMAAVTPGIITILLPLRSNTIFHHPIQHRRDRPKRFVSVMNRWKNWHRHRAAHSIIIIINTGWFTTTILLWKLLPIPKPPLRYCYRVVVEISTPRPVVAVAFLTEEDLFHGGEGVLP